MSAETLRCYLDAFIEKGERDDLCLLLFVGADVDGLVDGMTALQRAIAAQNMEAVRLLVDAGAGLEVEGRLWLKDWPQRYGAYRCSALHLACNLNQSEIVVFLLSRGANVNAEMSNKFRPLHIAAARGLKDLIQCLISYGAVVNAKDRQGVAPLWDAVAHGQRDTTELLLDRGACVNERQDNGRTPLFFAVGHREPLFGGLPRVCDHLNVAELLVSRGADVNAKCNEGGAVLHEAAFVGAEDLVEFFLRAGADVHATNKCGDTALHSAVLGAVLHRIASLSDLFGPSVSDYAKKLCVVEMFVSYGINVNAVNHNGVTALAIAERDFPENLPGELSLPVCPSSRMTSSRRL
eukprot:Cvel_4820.t1-p1 / transcript=Cvel_4820.t1 / gene=Cvel_4820 / organism=Chromera_velia_CCMP2878 / gene_product=Putative ankyrin repeat protein RF_0381, putative / transcript_product=Putative ankyrin repeat protein RF_0381, putative / location=Cvel_scaffold217:20128-21174(-) / protein_length=349 / sequence_SO=supercontig / SO=protein_coding / is_pseudo=false